MTPAEIDQCVRTLVFAGLTPSQRDALDKLTAELAKLHPAIDALYEIALLGEQADGQEARRLAQTALHVIGSDKLVVTLIGGKQLRVTSAAGNYDAEQEMLEAVRDAMDGILQAQGVDVQWGEIKKVEDRPADV